MRNQHRVLTALLTTAAVVTLTPHAAAPGAVRPAAHPVQVSVVDHTHGQWAGLTAAVAGWNQSPYVHLTVTDTCQPGTYCAVVVAGYYGPTTWGAQTSAPTAYSGSIVQVNTYTRPRSFPTTASQSAVLCHELGHVLGIPHPDRPATGARGCIAGADQNHVTPVASPADLYALARAAHGGPAQPWGAVVR